MSKVVTRHRIEIEKTETIVSIINVEIELDNSQKMIGVDTKIDKIWDIFFFNAYKGGPIFINSSSIYTF